MSSLGGPTIKRKYIFTTYRLGQGLSDEVFQLATLFGSGDEQEGLQSNNS